MAGLGQRFTSADPSASWSTQSQYTMGRTMLHDFGKPVTTYGSGFTKRPLFGSGTGGNTSTPSFSDIANLTASSYSSRPGSSQHNGELLNSLGGYTIRGAHPSTSDSAIENGPTYFNALNYNGTQSGSHRNFSESSLFSSLSTVNRTAGGDPGSRGLGSVAPMSINPAVAFTNSRNPGGIFPNSLGNESGPSNLTSLTTTRGMTLDPSEFPPILTSVSRAGNTAISSSFNSLSQPPLRNYVSVMSKGTTTTETSLSVVNHQYGTSGTNQAAPLELSKQDFPALTGTHPSVSFNQTMYSATSSLALNSSTTHRSLPSNPLSQTTTMPMQFTSRRPFNHLSNQVLHSTTGGQSGFSTVASKQSGPTAGLQLLPNHLVTNIPKNMICDQFGMLGLLKLIRVGDHDTTLNMLAPGLDLSSLHSNWQTTGELHSTFVSPCHESCIGRPQDVDYPVPPEYLIRHLITERLPDPPMNRLSDETLFWLFYNCCREEVQLVVAKELYQREWRFHKKEQIWLTRVVGANFTTDNNSEQGDYYFWDPIKAQKSTHQMNILYSDLDNAPAAFRLSSSTLSAFVTIGLPGSTHTQIPHANISQPQSQSAQQQFSVYQHQSSAYPLSHHQNLMNNTNTATGPILPHTTNTLTTGSPNAATLANLFNARQQKSQQLNPNSNCFPLHSRSGQLNSLIPPRSLSTPATSTNTTSSISTTNPIVTSESVTVTSASVNRPVASSIVTDNGSRQVGFESPQL